MTVATWIGQDGHDLVQTSSVVAPNDYQDIHIALSGLPTVPTITTFTITGFGGSLWAYNGAFGPFAAALVRTAGSSTADVYIEPDRVETGRQFTMVLNYSDSTQETITFAGGTADPNLRMPGTGLTVGWVGQDVKDWTGPGPQVGPDGIQDVHLTVGNVTAGSGATVDHFLITDPSGYQRCSGLNPGLLPNAEFFPGSPDPTIGDIYFNPDRNLSGVVLTVKVFYSIGKTDSATVTAGATNATLAMPPPAAIPITWGTISVAWVGQDGLNLVGLGDVHLVVSGIPSGRTIVQALLSDPTRLDWSYAASGHAQPEPAGQSLAVQAFSGDPTKADVCFRPIRNESGATLILRVVLDNGTMLAATFAGASADPGLKAAGPAATSTTVSPGANLNTACAAFGNVHLSAGTYSMSVPLTITAPVSITADPGTTISFTQPGATTWTAAIKVRASHVTLSGFAVRFTAPVVWAGGISYNPAVVGTTDNFDPGYNNPSLVAVALTNLDIEGPPVATGFVEAPSSVRLVGAENGSVTNCRIKGGSTEFFNGPWQFTGNTYLGPVPHTYCFGVFLGHYTHDVTIANNTAVAGDATSKTWRFLVLTNYGAGDVVRDNIVIGLGPLDADTVPPSNNPEIVLTESYQIHFEGIPSSISSDGRVLQVSNAPGGGAGAGDVVSILTGGNAGSWYRIAQPIGTLAYLMADPLPIGIYAVSISTGFVGETFTRNTIDARGSTTSEGIVLAGNHFGATLSLNSVYGTGTSYRCVATSTEAPVVWGWTRAPFLGANVSGNVAYNSSGGAYIVVEHGPAAKHSDVGRVYLSGTLSSNVFTWPASQAGSPVGITIGDSATADTAELILTSSGNMTTGPAGATIHVGAASINGLATTNSSSTLAAYPAGIYNFEALGLDGGSGFASSSAGFDVSGGSYWVAAWVKPTSVGSFSSVATRDDGGSNRQFGIYVTSSGQAYIESYGPGVSNVWTAAGLITNGVWNLVLGYFDAADGKPRIQANGVGYGANVGGASITPTAVSVAFRIGMRADGSLPLLGAVDGVAIGKGYVPTLADWIWLWNGGIGRSLTDWPTGAASLYSSLVSYYTFMNIAALGADSKGTNVLTAVGSGLTQVVGITDTIMPIYYVPFTGGSPGCTVVPSGTGVWGQWDTGHLIYERISNSYGPSNYFLFPTLTAIIGDVYSISLGWVPFAGRTTAARVTITDGTTTLFTHLIDQTQTPAAWATANGFTSQSYNDTSYSGNPSSDYQGNATYVNFLVNVTAGTTQYVVRLERDASDANASNVVVCDFLLYGQPYPPPRPSKISNVLIGPSGKSISVFATDQFGTLKVFTSFTTHPTISINGGSAIQLANPIWGRGPDLPNFPYILYPITGTSGPGISAIAPTDVVTLTAVDSWAVASSGPVAQVSNMACQHAPGGSLLPPFIENQKTMRVGYNLQGPLASEPARILSNWVRNSNYSNGGITLDSLGKPITLSSSGYFAITLPGSDPSDNAKNYFVGPSGTYTIRYKTTGGAFTFGLFSLGSDTIGSPTVTTLGDGRTQVQQSVTVPATGGPALALNIASSTGSYPVSDTVTNIEIYDSSINLNSISLFHPQYIQMIGNAKCLRFMDGLNTNGSTNVDFADFADNTTWTEDWGVQTYYPISSVGPCTNSDGYFNIGSQSQVSVLFTFASPHGFKNGQRVNIFNFIGPSGGGNLPITGGTWKPGNPGNLTGTAPDDVTNLNFAPDVACHVLSSTTIALTVAATGWVTGQQVKQTYSGGQAGGTIRCITRMGHSIAECVTLCNQVGADFWYNAPHCSTDACTTAVAQYAAANLLTGLKMHLEYSNETWNYLFAQYSYFGDNGKATASGTGLALTYAIDGQGRLFATITNPGQHYVTSVPITFTGGTLISGPAAYGWLVTSPTSGTGAVTSIYPVSQGHYSVAPTGFTLFGTGLAMTMAVDSNGFVVPTITNGGIGYVSQATQVVFTGGTFRSGTTTPTVGHVLCSGSGAVTSIGMDNFSQYSVAPTGFTTSVIGLGNDAWYVLRAGQHWSLAAAQFVAAGRSNDLIRTLATQGGYFAVGQSRVGYAVEQGIAIDEMAFAPYIHDNPEDTTLAAIYDSMDQDQLMDVAELSMGYDGYTFWGVSNNHNILTSQYPSAKLVCYEGGPELGALSSNQGIAAMAARSRAWARHPRMRGIMLQYFQILQDNGCVLFNDYMLNSNVRTTNNAYGNITNGSMWGAYNRWNQPAGLGDGTDGKFDNRTNYDSLANVVSVVGGAVNKWNTLLSAPSYDLRETWPDVAGTSISGLTPQAGPVWPLSSNATSVYQGPPVSSILETGDGFTWNAAAGSSLVMSTATPSVPNATRIQFALRCKTVTNSGHTAGIGFAMAGGTVSPVNRFYYGNGGTFGTDRWAKQESGDGSGVAIGGSGLTPGQVVYARLDITDNGSTATFVLSTATSPSGPWTIRASDIGKPIPTMSGQVVGIWYDGQMSATTGYQVGEISVAPIASSVWASGSSSFGRSRARRGFSRSGSRSSR